MTAPLSPCPDAEALSGFVEARLPALEAGAVERHVAACADCLDIVAAVLPSETTPASTADGRVQVARARRVSPMPVWLPGAIAALLVLVVGGLAGHFAARLVLARAADALATRMSLALGAPVTIDAVGLGATDTAVVVRLGGIRLEGESRGSAVASRVDLALPLTTLLRGDLAIARAEIVRPILAMQVASGTAAAGGRPAFELAKLWGVLARGPAIAIADGTLLLHLDDDSLLRIAALDLAVDGVTTRTLRATARVGTGVLALHGIREPDGALALRLDGRDLRLASPIAGLAVGGPVDLAATLVGSPTAPRLRLRLRMTEATIVPGALAMPTGPIIPPDAVGFRVRGLRLALRPFGTGWTIDRFAVTGPDGTLAAEGALSRGTLSGSGTLRVSPEAAIRLGMGSSSAAAGSEQVIPIVVRGTPDAPIVAPQP